MAAKEEAVTTEPTPRSQVTRLQLRILIAIVRGEITKRGDIFRFAKTNGFDDDLDDATLRGVWRHFDREGHAIPTEAARSIAERNLQDLTPEEREAVFRAAVTDVRGFLEWCFPLLTAAYRLVRNERRVALVPFFHEWVPGARYRWFVGHVLCHRHRALRVHHLAAEDFTTDSPLSGIMRTLEEFDVLDDWLDYAMPQADLAVLRREFEQRIVPLVRSDQFPDWMLGAVDRPGQVFVDHVLVLRIGEAQTLWAALRANDAAQQTGRLERACERLGLPLVRELYFAGYLEISEHDREVVDLNREKFRRSIIRIAEMSRLPLTPRVLPAPSGMRQEHSWVEVIRRAGTRAGSYDPRRHTRGAKPPQPAANKKPATSGAAPSAQPRLTTAVRLTTELHLTPQEGAALLELTPAAALGRRVDLTPLGEPLTRHLAALGYLSIAEGELIGTFDHGRFEQTIFDICDVDDAAFTNRFTPYQGGQTDRSWTIRLRRSVDRAAKRAMVEQQVAPVAYRFRITGAEAAALLRIAALSPFIVEEINDCLDSGFREVLRTFDYLHKDSGHAYRFRFQITHFEKVQPTTTVNVSQRFEEIPEADRLSVPATRWLEDVRTIARSAS